MTKIALALAAAGVLCAAPAFAQDVRIRAGDSGVTIRTDDHSRMERRHERRFGEERRWRHRDRDVYVTGSTGCRVTTVRSERPNGTVVVRKIRRCD